MNESVDISRTKYARKQVVQTPCLQTNTWANIRDLKYSQRIEYKGKNRKQERMENRQNISWKKTLIFKDLDPHTRVTHMFTLIYVTYNP